MPSKHPRNTKGWAEAFDVSVPGSQKYNNIKPTLRQDCLGHQTHCPARLSHK